MTPASAHISVLGQGYVRFIDSMGTDATIIEAARMSTGKGFLGWDPARLCVLCGVRQPPMTLENQVLLCSVTHSNGAFKEHRWGDHKGDANLLEFLYRNQHMTPFEMCDLHLEVYAPIEVFRQWQRHRSFSYNEFSARYAQMPNEHYVPAIERFKPVYSGNKQESSLTVLPGENVQPAELFQLAVAREQESAYEAYEAMIRAGVPKETARINTPVSRFSKMRVKGICGTGSAS